MSEKKNLFLFVQKVQIERFRPTRRRNGLCGRSKLIPGTEQTQKKVAEIWISYSLPSTGKIEKSHWWWWWRKVAKTLMENSKRWKESRSPGKYQWYFAGLTEPNLSWGQNFKKPTAVLEKWKLTTLNQLWDQKVLFSKNPWNSILHHGIRDTFT